MAADPEVDAVDVKETSTAGAPGKGTPTPGKVGKWVSKREKGKEVEENGREVSEEGAVEGSGQEEGEEDLWDIMGGAHEERAATTPGDLAHEDSTAGGDGTSLYYRQFTRMESRDFEEPGTTRSYVVVEKSTKVDYSSSSVVSEVYDSDSPAEEDATEDPSAARTNEGPRTPSTVDAGDGGHSGEEEEEEASDSPEDAEEERLEEEPSDAGPGHTTTAPDLGVTKDQDPASSVRGGDSIARLRTSRGPGRTRAPTPVPTTSTETDPETTARSELLEVTTPPRERNQVDYEGSELNGASSQTDAPLTTTMASNSSKLHPKESSHGSRYATVRSTMMATSTYTPRTSRRLNVLRLSTTESPVKNEVTYNESITGPTYDFKANISLTTPMALLMLSDAPTTSTVAPTEAEAASQIPSALPTTSQTTDQLLSSLMPMSVAVAASTTEPSHLTTEEVVVEDSQGRGNSINDWSTVSSSGSMASSREIESMTTLPTTLSSGSESYESPTSSPLSSSVTSSVLYTTVQNVSTSDLVSNSMSSTLEEAMSVTLSGSTVTSSDSVSERVMTDTAKTFGSENDSSSVSPVSESTFESTQFADNVTTSAADVHSSGVTPALMELSSSTTHDLLPYKVKTKLPAVNPTDEDGTSSKEVEINESYTVQPMSISVNQNPTSPPKDSSTFTATMDSSPKTTFAPIVVKLNGSGNVGTMDPWHKMSTASSGTVNESEESIITYPWHIRLRMKISWSEVCHSRQQFTLKQALAQLISSALTPTSSHSILPTDRVLMLNVAESCPNTSGSPSEVHFCILSSSALGEPSSEYGRGEVEGDDGKGTTVVHCDAALMQLFLNIWDKTPKPMVEPLTHVKEVGIARSGMNVDVPANPVDDNAGVQAAISISCVAAVAFFLLAALLITMRRRQRRFNYGQRCTPVSLDAYSLDSVSVPEGSRRGRARNGGVGRQGVNGLTKADGTNDWRASKRSYGNPAFEDDDGEEVLLSKPMNFATLTNAALDEEGALADEFRLIPKRFHRRTVRRRKSRSRYKDPAGTAERGETSTKDNDDDDDRLPEGAEEKNRYANVVPLPSTRVHLSARSSGPLSTYINANFVRGPKNEEQFYIACQAPLQSTIEDFWRMIWEQQSKVILMLTNLVENSAEKCADYLPPSEVLDCHRLFGDFQVTLKKREVREKYIVSSLQLKDMESNLWREVTHLWFLGWPDQGVPEEPNQIIAFLIEARSFIKTNPGPTVVHCSPGTGRTGTVISIDICIREFEQSRMIDVPKVVQQLRRDREGAVQTQQQYTFIYKALSLYAAKLTGGAMDSF